MSNLKISIIGLGFVGSAMQNSFLKKGFQQNINIFVYDKYKNGGIGTFESILNGDIIFLALPTKYDEANKTYDTRSIKETCKILMNHNYRGAVVIKSTVLPKTTNNLREDYDLNFVHNPEFLTARTATKDFHEQTHIVLGKSIGCADNAYKNVVDFYRYYYPRAEISECNSSESESMKIFVNCFYSVKVQFMNELYSLCKNMDINYNSVRNMMLKNNWISPHHTDVPGPDGKLSYGGLCFPKDTNALNEMMIKYNSFNSVLSATIEERNIMRNDELNIIKK
jgi:nucleotide sugar dehydrogenase